LNLKLSIPKTDLEIETVTDIFPGATLYERELMEMLGVQVKGHPDPRRLFLSDDWPAGKFPLRKEVKK
jgi:Ni,Fe-hydrogenase III component G